MPGTDHGLILHVQKILADRPENFLVIPKHILVWTAVQHTFKLLVYLHFIGANRKGLWPSFRLNGWTEGPRPNPRALFLIQLLPTNNFCVESFSLGPFVFEVHLVCPPRPYPENSLPNVPKMVQKCPRVVQINNSSVLDHVGPFYTLLEKLGKSCSQRLKTPSKSSMS